MQALFWLANHSEKGQVSLEDPIGIFGHQLRALGHEAVWDRSNEKFITGEGRYNIVVEGFVPAMIPLFEEYYAKGARFLCLATEEPTPKGFNWGRDREMQKRQEVFPKIAHLFDGIFHLVPGQHVHDWYAQFAPTSYVELGYAPTLVRSKHTDREPIFDFGFFGSLTNRRISILKKLARYVGSEKAVRVEGTFPSQQERDRIMREAKVIVQVRKFEEMGLVSSTRCNTALCLGRPVVAEPHLLSEPWDKVVKFSKSLDGFFSDCVLARAAWRGIHAYQMDKFKTLLTPEYCVGRAFKEIGIDLATGKRMIAA